MTKEMLQQLVDALWVLELILFALILYNCKRLINKTKEIERRFQFREMYDNELVNFIEKLRTKEREKWFAEMESKGWEIIYYTCPVTEITEKYAVKKDGVTAYYKNEII